MSGKISTEEKVYRFVCENPGNCTYDISRMLRMSGGRVRNALDRLNKKGLIRFKFQRHSPRIRKLSYPIETMNLLPTSIKKEISSV